jgi:hypothetical protein
VQLEDVVVPETAPVDLGGGISYHNHETPNDAYIGVFGSNDDDESDSDSDGDEEDKFDAVGDGQDCLRKALAQGFGLLRSSKDRSWASHHFQFWWRECVPRRP